MHNEAHDIAADEAQIATDPLERDAVLRIAGLQKTFDQAGEKLTIFKGLSLRIDAGEIVALVGPSGAGKSTLMQIAGLLDKPTSGKIAIAGKRADTLSDVERTKLRRESIGFVYQFHHLLPEFTAHENAAMPLIIAGVKRKDALEKAEGLLRSMGLGHRLSHRPARMSGGEQQRVAIARALANDPKLVFADEPTGNLDPATASEVFDILLAQVRERRIGALIATHNLQLADQMDRVMEMKAGKLIAY